MEENEFIEVYKEYWNVLKDNQRSLDLLEYDWIKMPSSIPFEWMAYSQYLNEHAQELANSINQLAVSTRKMSIWQMLLEKRSEEENKYIVNEFIEPLATLCLNLPYAIRGRFIFSVSHLSHQANMKKVSNWKDNLAPDKSINFKVMEKASEEWSEYPGFRSSLSLLSDSEFSDQVHNFRNKYHHRYPPRVEFGQTQMVTRNIEDGKVSYGFGYIEPLQIRKMVPLLEAQHEAAYNTFRRYQALVNEQISVIFST